MKLGELRRLTATLSDDIPIVIPVSHTPLLVETRAIVGMAGKREEGGYDIEQDRNWAMILVIQEAVPRCATS